MKKTTNKLVSVLLLFFAIMAYSNVSYAVSAYCTDGPLPQFSLEKTTYTKTDYDSYDSWWGYIRLYYDQTSAYGFDGVANQGSISGSGTAYTYEDNPYAGFWSWEAEAQVLDVYNNLDYQYSSFCNHSTWFTSPTVDVVISPATVYEGETVVFDLNVNVGDDIEGLSCIYNGSPINPNYYSEITVNESHEGEYRVDCENPFGSHFDSAYLTVEPNQCDVTDTNSVAYNQAYNWGGSVPYELGVSIYCWPNGTHSLAYYRDSFGQVYSGYSPTNDPCTVNLVTNSTYAGGDLQGALHAHPYFSTPSQYTAGNGCHGDTSTPTIFEISQLNDDNKNFGFGDPFWNSTTQTPLYLRVPLANQVKKRNTNGSVVVIN